MKKIHLVLLLALLSHLSCSQKKYSVTTYETSLEERNDFHHKRFKYAYAEYNADSNVIYEEQYASFDYAKKLWGELISKTSNSYSGLLLQSSVTEFILGKSEDVKTTARYEYENDQLVKKIQDGKTTVEYIYDTNHRLSQEKNVGEYPSYTQYFYNPAGLKIKQMSYLNNTLASTATFSYDKNNKLIDELVFNNKGNKLEHRQYIRNNDGLLIEEKWRTKYDYSRMREDGSLIDEEFYESKKYFYTNNHCSKIIQYSLSEPVRLYEFEYK